MPLIGPPLRRRRGSSSRHGRSWRAALVASWAGELERAKFPLPTRTDKIRCHRGKERPEQTIRDSELSRPEPAKAAVPKLDRTVALLPLASRTS